MSTSNITENQGEAIKKMAREGKSIGQIRTALANSHDYQEIQMYMWEQDCITLQGAKKAIAIRAKKLRKATRESERVKLGQEINNFANHIYTAGKQTQRKLEKYRKKLANIKVKAAEE
jgi:DNA-binding ferritin-like protein (Dps family)